MQKYPEHEKLKKIKDESHTIGAFLEWLRGDRGLVIAAYRIPRDSVNNPAGCGYCEDQLQPEHIGIEALLAEYFEINLAEIEQEKRQMLESLRS